MCQKESWGAIFATKEAHSTQRCQPPRMHGPGLWRYKQKEQRVTPVLMSGVNCDLWCRGGTAKISEVGQSKTQDTPPDQGTNTEYDPLLEGQPVELLKVYTQVVEGCSISAERTLVICSLRAIKGLQNELAQC